MVAITKTNYAFASTLIVKKRSYFQLHKNRDLCIITLRPPPRWTKWSRGVRTRGLRVGLVGGPRPLLFFGACFKPASNRRSSDNNSFHTSARLTFERSGIRYRKHDPCTICFETRSSEHRASSGVATVGIVDKPGCGIFSATITRGPLTMRKQWRL